MAWCWFNATESKPQNVVCNIFSELTQNTSLLFFHKKINENIAEKICSKLKSEANFVEKLCVENTLRETKLCVTFDSRKINFVLIFKFRK